MAITSYLTVWLKSTPHNSMVGSFTIILDLQKSKSNIFKLFTLSRRHTLHKKLRNYNSTIKALHDENINQLDLTLLLHSYAVIVFSIEKFSTSKLCEVPCKRWILSKSQNEILFNFKIWIRCKKSTTLF